MLRIQLILAALVLLLLLTLAGTAAASLLVALGAPPALAVIISISFVALRLLAPFRLPYDTATPTGALDRGLALMHVTAVTHLLLPAATIPLTDQNTADALRAVLPLLVALVTELAVGACLQTLSPSIRAALTADIAVAQWFASRRIDLERELLDSMGQHAIGDMRLRHRLERLTRRFDQQLALYVPPEPDAFERHPGDTP